ncbi:MAG: fimbrial biogenesis outer membrane usher protein [Gammaproteobacteria bacterium]|nr:fimbrial biogenesis outer membrane usher protein [Gammaproteobacteria bacterium]
MTWATGAEPPAAVLRAGEAGGTSEMVLELRLNGRSDGEACIVLLDGDRNLWLERQDFHRLRLRPPLVTARRVADREYLPLAALAGVHASVDVAASTVDLTLPASAFVPTTQSLPAHAAPPRAHSARGAFLNYELYAQHGDYAGGNSSGALGELGLFAGAGVLTSTAAAGDIDGRQRLLRLETTFTRDFPAALRTLRLGDAISTPGAWGHAVRFGGIQWGTNFGTRPDLVTTPLMSAGGAAVVPSSVDVFVNGQPVGTTQVPAGPFVIDRLPTVTGSGEVRLVVHDALGREQTITLPFYSSPALLRPGLSRYSFEIGALRRDFGRTSNDYGELLAAATWRTGLTRHLTAELHAEGVRDGALAAGVDLAVAIGRLGVLAASLASGGEGADRGWLAAGGFERSGRRFSMVLRVQLADRGFRQVGDTPGMARPRLRELAQLGLNLGRAGNLSAAVVSERYFSGPAHRVYSLAHNLGIGRGFLGLNLGYADGAARSRSAYLTFTLPLDAARSAGASLRYDDALPPPDTALGAELQRAAPPGSGYGYRLSATSAGSYDAAWIQQFEPVAIEADVARFAGVSAQRLTLSGGATYLGGDLRATRTVQDSFALIDADGIEGLTVYVDNQPVTRTDSQGQALVRNLRPYEPNRIGIDATQLPLDTSIGAESIEVVPAWRSGALVRLPVERVRGGEFRLIQRGGAAVPAGAIVRFQGAEFPVGLDGQTYVTGYDHGVAGEAYWPGGRCVFRVPPPPLADPLPQLGDITCRALGP